MEKRSNHCRPSNEWHQIIICSQCLIQTYSSIKMSPDRTDCEGLDGWVLFDRCYRVSLRQPHICQLTHRISRSLSLRLTMNRYGNWTMLLRGGRSGQSRCAKCTLQKRNCIGKSIASESWKFYWHWQQPQFADRGNHECKINWLTQSREVTYLGLKGSLVVKCN